MISITCATPGALGAAALNVNASADDVADVPEGVTTVTSPFHAGSAG